MKQWSGFLCLDGVATVIAVNGVANVIAASSVYKSSAPAEYTWNSLAISSFGARYYQYYQLSGTHLCHAPALGTPPAVALLESQSRTPGMAFIPNFWPSFLTSAVLQARPFSHLLGGSDILWSFGKLKNVYRKHMSAVLNFVTSNCLFGVLSGHHSAALCSDK